MWSASAACLRLLCLAATITHLRSRSSMAAAVIISHQLHGSVRNLVNCRCRSDTSIKTMAANSQTRPLPVEMGGEALRQSEGTLSSTEGDAKDTAISRLRPQGFGATRAGIEELASVGRHCFRLHASAVRASDCGLRAYQYSGHQPPLTWPAPEPRKNRRSACRAPTQSASRRPMSRRHADTRPSRVNSQASRC